jgi:hypothetical protein
LQVLVNEQKAEVLNKADNKKKLKRQSTDSSVWAAYIIHLKAGRSFFWGKCMASIPSNQLLKIEFTGMLKK